jgi:gluconate 5-dehydrogenase
MNADFIRNMYSLDGKIALVTGGSRGIGFGIAEYLAKAGAEVAITARSEQTLKQASDRFTGMGIPVHVFPADLSVPDNADRLFDLVVSETGGADILVNNAGTTYRAPADAFPDEEWDRVMNVNLTSLFRLSAAFARHCAEKKKPGKIINIASLLSEAARPTIPAYAASKGAVRQLTKALSVEWASYSIQVNAIGPGYIETDMTEKLIKDEAFDAWVRERTPQQRWGKPEDIAGAALFLASRASDFITGQILYVDGGWLASL